MSGLDGLLSIELSFEKESKNIIWQGITVLYRMQEIEIKTDGGFQFAVLSLRGDSATVLEIKILKRTADQRIS